MLQDIAGIGAALIVALDDGLDLVTGTLEVIDSTSQAVTLSLRCYYMLSLQRTRTAV